MSTSDMDGAEADPVVSKVFASNDPNVDNCEKIVSFLEFATSYNRDANLNEHASIVFEKGSLYRGFVSLDGLSFIEQILYLFQKFNEYNERLIVIDQKLSFCRRSNREVLSALADLLGASFESNFENAVLVEFPSVYAMFHVVGKNVVIVLHRHAGGEVYSCAFEATSTQHLAGVLHRCILPLIPDIPQSQPESAEGASAAGSERHEADTQALPAAESFGAQMAWLVRAGVSSAALSPGARAARQDALDDQVVLLSQILRAARQAECRQRVHDLRGDLLAIRSALTQAATPPPVPPVSAAEQAEPHNAEDTCDHADEPVGEEQKVDIDRASHNTLTAGEELHKDDNLHSEDSAEAVDQGRDFSPAEAAPTEYEQQLSRDADESLLRGGSGSNDDHGRHAQDLQHQQNLHHHHHPDTEGTDLSNAEVEGEGGDSDEEGVDAFAQVMDRLGQYGSGLSRSLAECAIEGLAEEHNSAAQDDTLGGVADGEKEDEQVEVDSQGEEDTHHHHPSNTGEEDEEQRVISEPDPRRSSSPSPPAPPHHISTTKETPQEEAESAFHDAAGEEGEGVSRALFHDEEGEPADCGPVASTTEGDSDEAHSASFQPTASAEPTVALYPAHHGHSHSHSHHPPEPSALPPPPAPAGPPLAPPLSSSMVADLVSSVGGESQSVGFSHYIHRAYELIKESAVESALQQEEQNEESDDEEGDEGEEGEEEEGPAATSQEEDGGEGAQEETQGAGAGPEGGSGGGDTGDDSVGEGEYNVVSTSLDDNRGFLEAEKEAAAENKAQADCGFYSHAIEPGPDETSIALSPARPTSAHTPFLLESPLQLRDQQPGPADSPAASPLVLHGQPNDGQVNSYRQDLIPTPHAHKHDQGQVLRPLTASMVDALPPSGPLDRGGSQKEQQGAIEDYSAAAYQMFKNRALADLLFDDGREADAAEDDDQSGQEEEEGEGEREEGGEEDREGEGEGEGGEASDASRNGTPDVVGVEGATIGSDETHLGQDVREEPDAQDANPSMLAEPTTQQASHAPLVLPQAAVSAVHPVTAPLLSPQQVRQLSARLEALRREVEAEEEAVKAEKNRHRLEVGRRVLAVLFAEKALPAVASGSNDATHFTSAPNRAEQDQPTESPIRDVSVRSNGISFTAAPSDAVVAERPVLSHMHNRPTTRGSPSDRTDSAEDGFTSSPQGRLLHSQQHQQHQPGRAGSATASRLPRPAQTDPAPAIPSPAKPVRSAVRAPAAGSPNGMRAADAFVLPPPPRTVAAPPPRLQLGGGSTLSGAVDTDAIPLRSARDVPPPTSARAQSAGRAGRKLSNYAQIKNAINSVCMAGSHFDSKRIEVFEILDHFRFAKQMSPLTEEQFVNDYSFLQDCKGAVAHFLIMFFQSKTLSFKGIYAADPNTGAFMRVFGKGPKEFTDGSIPVQQFLKFETPSKSFKQIHVKNFSHNVDAFILDAVALKYRQPIDK